MKLQICQFLKFYHIYFVHTLNMFMNQVISAIQIIYSSLILSNHRSMTWSVALLMIYQCKYMSMLFAIQHVMTLSLVRIANLAVIIWRLLDRSLLLVFITIIQILIYVNLSLKILLLNAVILWIVSLALSKPIVHMWILSVLIPSRYLNSLGGILQSNLVELKVQITSFVG